MSIETNSNIDIILIDSLESLHQREFGRAFVVLVSHCHERLTTIKGEMKWKIMEEKWIGQSSGNGFSLHTGFFVFLSVLVPLLVDIFLHAEVFKCFLSFYILHQLIDQIRIFLCA